MTEALSVPTQNTNLSHQEADFSGFGDQSIGAQDFELPRLRLLQPLSKAVSDEKAKPGEWFNSLKEEAYGSSILFVPAVNFKNRVRLAMGSGLLCRSLDMVNGNGNPGLKVDENGHGGCAICKYKEWPADRRAAGEQLDGSVAGPECGESLNWVGLVIGMVKDGKTTMLDDPEMAVIQWRSTSIKAARKLNGLYINAKITNPGLQWHDRMYRLDVEKVKNDKGTFYSPAVSQAGKTTDELRKQAISLLSVLSGHRMAFEATEEDLSDAPRREPVATGTGDGNVDF